MHLFAGLLENLAGAALAAEAGEVHRGAEPDAELARKKDGFAPWQEAVGAVDGHGDDGGAGGQGDESRAGLEGLEAAVGAAGALGEDQQHLPPLEQPDRAAQGVLIGGAALDREGVGAADEGGEDGDPKQLGLGHEADGAGAGGAGDGGVGVAGVVGDEQDAARVGDVLAPRYLPAVVVAEEKAEEVARDAIERGSLGRNGGFLDGAGASPDGSR